MNARSAVRMDKDVVFVRHVYDTISATGRVDGFETDVRRRETMIRQCQQVAEVGTMVPAQITEIVAQLDG